MNVNKNEVRERLRHAGAVLRRPEFLQRRVTFDLPPGKADTDIWLRVRDEGDKITLTLKAMRGKGIERQKEITLTVDNFRKAEMLLQAIGCQWRMYQENRREIWELDGVEVMLEKWPFLEPYLEIEGHSEEEVKQIAEKLGFDYSQALFCATGAIYKIKYGLAPDEIKGLTRLIFEMKNPFPKN